MLRSGPYTREEEEALLNRRRIQIASARKLRLVACASCRQIWGLLTHAPSHAAVETAERYADDVATVEELTTAHQTGRPCYFYHTNPTADPAAYAAHPDPEAGISRWGDVVSFAAAGGRRSVQAPP